MAKRTRKPTHGASDIQGSGVNYVQYMVVFDQVVSPDMEDDQADFAEVIQEVAGEFGMRVSSIQIRLDFDHAKPHTH